VQSGGISENLQYARGESQKNKLQGGIQKQPYFVGDNNYLTLNRNSLKVVELETECGRERRLK
jgi:hypothetical protein